MKKILIIFILTILSLGSYSQLPLLVVDHEPEYLLPSAEAISRIKPVVRPEGLSAGIPNITVPLWNNKFTNYSIAISYHASGLQVNEEASCVGLGWRLEAGGIIARVVRGLPDDMESNGYLNLSSADKAIYDQDINQFVNSNSATLANIGGSKDASPDIFYYNFLGRKGKFVFDQDGEIVSIPHNNLKISYATDASGIRSFEILTPDGLTYRFASKEEIELTGDVNFTYNSAWYLSEVKKLTRSLTSYSYEIVTENRTRKLYDYKYYNNQGTLLEGTATVDMLITRPQIHTIQDDAAKCTFNYNATNRLENIEVKDINNRRIIDKNNPELLDLDDRLFDKLEYINDCFLYFKSIEFNYDDFTLSGGGTNEERTRKLASVSIGRNSRKTYTFSYNETAIPDINSIEQDLWGYYNNNNASSFFPTLYHNNGTYDCFDSIGENLSGANRGLNETALKAGILTKIENPLGGITEYTYEPQKAIYKGVEIYAGGLRVKSVAKSDNNPNPIHPASTVSYSYTDFDDESSTATTGIVLGAPNFAYNVNNPGSTELEENTYTYSDYAYGISGVYSNPIFYEQVTVSNSGTGYVVKEFEMPVMNPNFYSGQVGQSTDLSYTNTILYTDIRHYDIKVDYLGNNFLQQYCYDWNTPYLIRERTFDQYRDLKNEVEYFYKDIEGYQLISGYFSSPQSRYSVITYDYELQPPLKIVNQYNSRSLKKFYYCPSWKLLESTVTTVYEYRNKSQKDQFTKTNTYYYDEVGSNYRFPIKTETTDVNGNKHFTEMKYPYHYSHADGLELEIQNYESDLRTRFSPDDYIVDYGTEFLIRKTIPFDRLPPVPDTIKGGELQRVAIETMKVRRRVNQPIETVSGIEVNGFKTILSGKINKFKILDNNSIVLDKELILEGPVDYSTYNPSYILLDFYYDSKYREVKSYEYNDLGEPIGEIFADGNEIYYKYSVVGNNVIAKAINTPYSVIEDYTGNDYNLRTNGNKVITYQYKSLVGKSKVTDIRGRSTYYIYDLDGNLVGTKDHDKNLRAVYTHNLVNETNNSQVDILTDPDGDDILDDQSGELQATIISCNDVEISINNFNDKYSYFVDFGDGSPEQEITSADQTITHTYAQEEECILKVREMYNNYVVQELSQSIILPYTAMEANVTLWNLSETKKRVNVDISNGSGNYTANWNISRTYLGNTYSSTDTDTYTGGCDGNTTFSNLFSSFGSYVVEVEITDGKTTISDSVSFTVDELIPLP